MTTIFEKANKFLFVFVVSLLSLCILVKAQTIIPPLVLSESALQETSGNLTFRASVWTNQGQPVPVVTWFEWTIIGDPNNYKSKEKERLSNSSFSFTQPIDSTKTYCFTPYAQKLDKTTNQKIGDPASGTRLCYPDVPFVETLYPGQYTNTSAYLKGRVVSFRGLSSGYMFFQRYDKNNPTKSYSSIGGRTILRTSSDTSEFSGYFSDFDLSKNGPLCYKACASKSALTAKSIFNCGEEVCFPFDDNSEGKFEATAKIEPLKNDCQKAKVTLDISCLGKIIDKERIPMDIVFVLDKSGTMKGQTWESTKKAVKAFISKLDKKNDHIALVSFARYASYDNNSGLTDRYDEINAGLDKITIAVQETLPPATNIGEGLRLAEDLFSKKARKDSKRVVILITDGIANAGEKGGESEEECPSWPIIANNCTKYAEKEANLVKGKYNAEMYTVRYSDPRIDSAHLQAATFSKALLKNIAWPLTVMDATTPQEIENQFAQIVFALTKYYERDYFCDKVVANHLMPENIKYVKTLTTLQPTTNGQNLIFDVGKIINGTRHIEFIVQFPDEKIQPANVIPDSKVTYTDWKGNSQEKVFEKLEAKDLVKCADVKFETEKTAIPYRDQEHCQIVEITLKVKCVSTNINNDQNNKPMCKNVVVIDYLPKGVHYFKIPYEATPNYDSLIDNNPNTGETRIIWKLPDMLPESQKTIRFNVLFDTAEKNQLVDIYPDSKVEGANSKGEKISTSFPETKADPLECKAVCQPCTKTLMASGDIIYNGSVTTLGKMKLGKGYEKFGIKNVNLAYITSNNIADIDCIMLELKQDKESSSGNERYESLKKTQKDIIANWVKNGGKLIVILTDYSRAQGNTWNFEWLPYKSFAQDGDTLLGWINYLADKVIINNSLFSNDPKKENYIKDTPTLWENTSISMGDDWSFMPLNDNEWWGAVSMRCGDTGIPDGALIPPYRKNNLYSFAYSKYIGKGMMMFNGVDLDGVSWSDPIDKNTVLGKILYYQLDQSWDKKYGKDACGLTYDHPIPKFDRDIILQNDHYKNMKVETKFKIISFESDKNNGTKIEINNLMDKSVNLKIFPKDNYDKSIIMKMSDDKLLYNIPQLFIPKDSNYCVKGFIESSYNKKTYTNNTICK